MAVIEVPTRSTLSREISPARLREMDSSELLALAAEIRRFLVTSVSVTGGHLGSNLGAVELTLALHRVFSSPHDAIVWDTGHQAYVHKLVTGRQDAFVSLRQRGGLSGYPNRSESEHDLVENSHASTALSYAYGLAKARQLRGDPHRVVAVVGDGSLTGGVAYEALNNIGISGANVIVVLNDNGRSYAPTVSRISSAGSFTTGESLTEGERSPAQDLLRSPRPQLSRAGRRPRSRVPRGGAAASSPGAPGRSCSTCTRPRAAGYGPAELDEEKCLHDVGPFDPETGLASRRPPGG